MNIIKKKQTCPTYYKTEIAAHTAFAQQSLPAALGVPRLGFATLRQKTAATSGKQDVICKKRKNILIGHPWPHFFI